VTKQSGYATKQTGYFWTKQLGLNTYGYAKPDINTQPLFYSLRDNEIYLDIGNEEKINNTFEIVCQWMDKILIPKMNELCATE